MSRYVEHDRRHQALVDACRFFSEWGNLANTLGCVNIAPLWGSRGDGLVLLQLLPLEATKVSQVQAGRSHYPKRAISQSAPSSRAAQLLFAMCLLAGTTPWES